MLVRAQRVEQLNAGLAGNVEEHSLDIVPSPANLVFDAMPTHGVVLSFRAFGGDYGITVDVDEVGTSRSVHTAPVGFLVADVSGECSVGPVAAWLTQSSLVGRSQLGAVKCDPVVLRANPCVIAGMAPLSCVVVCRLRTV